jgi:hypothetical protein
MTRGGGKPARPARRRWRVPTWYQLRALGEQRLLRVSYLVLVLIPLTAHAIHCWNEQVAERYRLLQEERRHFTERLDKEIRAISADPSAMLPAWWAAVRNQDDPGSRGRSSADIGQVLGLAPVELRDEIVRWDQAALDETLARAVPRLQTGPSLKCLFFAAVFISSANFLYAWRCPISLRSLSFRGEGSSGARLGDDIEWNLCLLGHIAQGENASARVLSHMLARSTDFVPPPSNEGLFDPVVWVTAMWDHLQGLYPSARALCAVLYGAGLLLVLAVIALRAYAVVNT